jgi:SAM-dependent methyltransferase
MHRFCGAFGVEPGSLVLDIGGTPEIWSVSPTRPRLLILNILPPASRTPGVMYVQADARRLPFPDGAFPIVFSNSVMEHVGNYQNQRQFAAEIRRVGRRYFIQTGNRRFPLEIHLMTPFVHWLPKAWQRRLIRNFTVRGWLGRPSAQEVEAFLREVRLPTEREMRDCFPGATIWYERVLSMKKALIAVKL